MRDLTWSNIMRALVAEFLYCFFVNFFGCGAAISTANYGHYWTNITSPDKNDTNTTTQPAQPVEQFFYGDDYHVMVPLAMGMLVTALVATFQHASGAHGNPSITIAAIAIQKINLYRGLLYLPCQFIGAIVGSAILKALLPEVNYRSDVFVARVLSPSSVWQACIWEALLSFLLMLVYLVVFRDPGELAPAIGPLIIGVVVMLNHCATLYTTAGSCNPARAFGAALVSLDFTDIWVFLIFSPIGAVLGAILHFVMFMDLMRHENDEDFLWPFENEEE